MEKLLEQLSKIGISNPQKIYHNLSYDELYQHETDPSLTGFDKAYKTKSGALSVDTRSPKDKYIVMDDETPTTSGGPAKARKAPTTTPSTTRFGSTLKN